MQASHSSSTIESMSVGNDDKFLGPFRSRHCVIRSTDALDRRPRNLANQRYSNTWWMGTLRRSLSTRARNRRRYVRTHLDDAGQRPDRPITLRFPLATRPSKFAYNVNGLALATRDPARTEIPPDRGPHEDLAAHELEQRTDQRMCDVFFRYKRTVRSSLSDVSDFAWNPMQLSIRPALEPGAQPVGRVAWSRCPGSALYDEYQGGVFDGAPIDAHWPRTLAKYVRTQASAPTHRYMVDPRLDIAVAS